MTFLRRLFGRGSGSGDDSVAPPADGADATDAAESDAGESDAAEPDDDERARELRLLNEEQAGLDDLVQRQQRYAHLRWQPPRQGGERRADDPE